MDKAEWKARQAEGMRLRRELGDFEYRKIKAARRKEYREQMQEVAKEVMGEKYRPIDVMLKPPKVKPRGSYVQITVSDDTGEYTQIWEAPALTGTVMASNRGKGYLTMAKPVLQQLFGKLIEK